MVVSLYREREIALHTIEMGRTAKNWRFLFICFISWEKHRI